MATVPKAHPLVYAVLLSTLAWTGAYRLERRFVYRPNPTLAGMPGGPNFTNAWFPTVDGLRLNGWLLDGDQDKPVLLFFHGGAGNLSDRLEKLRALNRLGYTVFAFDYRGYGRSKGNPSERGTYRDAEAAYFHLTRTWQYSRDRIVFYGESLGSGVAVEMALRHPSAAVILENPFTSVPDLAARRYPAIPAGWILDRYDNIAKIRWIRAPLLVLHTPWNEIIPDAMGMRIAAAAPEPKRFVSLKDDDYSSVIREFLNDVAEKPVRNEMPRL